MTALEDVRALEQARISAMLKGDHQSIAQYLDQDLIYVHSTGLVDGRDSYLASLRDGKYVYETIEVIEERHVQGADFVVLVQVLSVVIRVAGADAAPLPRQVAASSLWRRSQGQWKLAVMQATPRAT
jgi:ketosteroid isomerase-like protein